MYNYTVYVLPYIRRLRTRSFKFYSHIQLDCIFILYNSTLAAIFVKEELDQIDRIRMDCC